MHFRSLTNLSEDVVRSLPSIPRDVDVVVGIPRSGMLPATLLALAANIPLADLDGFLEGRLLSAGRTRRHAAIEVQPSDIRHVLLVDDSARTGRAMREATEKLERLSGLRVTTYVVYGIETSGKDIDIVAATVPEPRVFQWNVMHHSVLAAACVDLDGILCVDPLPHQNDDGALYVEFLKNAQPLHLPTRPINAIVTSRLEKYRSLTDEWLAKWGVKYETLAMLDLPNAEERRRLNAHAAFKARVFRKLDAKLFIESDERQAGEIAELSGKSVLWLPGACIVYPGGRVPRSNPTVQRSALLAKRTLRRFLGDQWYAKLKDARRALR